MTQAELESKSAIDNVEDPSTLVEHLSRPLGDAHSHRIDYRKADDDQAYDRHADNDSVEYGRGRPDLLVELVAGQRLDLLDPLPSRLG